jgi:ABC-type branched-subunit amino acid transport system ATPase component
MTLVSPNGGDSEPYLQVTEVSKRFGGETVVDAVSLAAPRGQVTGLIGPNGAGKTTLFNLITGFVDADSGEVAFKGNRITNLRPDQILRRGLARTFQELRLCESLSVVENVQLAMQGQPGESLLSIFTRWRRCARVEREGRSRAIELLELVGLGQFADHLPNEMSYGQQKRLALARVLATGAEFLCLDEPSAGHDPKSLADAETLLARLVQEEHVSVLLVEHNLEIVGSLCSHVVFMNKGRIDVAGPAKTVLDDPRVLAGFMGVSA